MMVKDNELGRLDAIFHQNDVRLALVGTKRWTPHMYSLQVPENGSIGLDAAYFLYWSWVNDTFTSEKTVG